MGDDDDGHLLFAYDPADDLKELVRFLRRQNRRRFVEDQNIRAAIERFQDLDALLQTDRNVAHLGGRIDLEPVFLDELARQLFRLAVVEQHAGVFRLAS